MYTIEMLWECSSCQTLENKGLDRFCPHCGKPKEDKDREYFPEDISEQNALQGEQDRLAKAGPDWKCKYCEALQGKLSPFCTQCGASQETGKLWSPNPESEVIASQIPAPPKATQKTVRKVKDLPKEETPSKETLPKVYLEPVFKKTHLLFLLVPTLPLLLYFLFRTREVKATVTQASWTHTVWIDRYRIIQDEGWYPPGDALHLSSSPRIHHYDRVPSGSHTETYSVSVPCGQTCRTVPGTCSTSPRTCTSNRNGTATCSGGNTTCSPSYPSCQTKFCPQTKSKTVTDYKEVPVLLPYYNWEAWRWDNNFRKVSRQGSFPQNPPSWPEPQELAPPLGVQERSHQVESYSITLSYEKSSTTVSPSSETEFLRIANSKNHRVQVSLAGPSKVLD